ncbi:MAG: hypothetical protein H6923_10470 [Alphaproteobacteria bacterium]|nr:hypothetical protein [Alphaproteobacteria bacterium]
MGATCPRSRSLPPEGGRAAFPRPGRVLGAALLAASLAGCMGGDPTMAILRLGPSPAATLPFADETGTQTPALLGRIATGAVVALPDVKGLPDALDGALRGALVAAADSREIAVIRGDRSGGDTLRGRAAIEGAGDETKLSIAWRLEGPDGAQIEAFAVDAAWDGEPPIVGGELAESGRALARRLAEASADGLRAALDRRDGVTPNDVLGPSRPPVPIALTAVTGAPGDGETRLAAAIAGVLSGRGYAVSRSARDAPFRLAVSVDVSEESKEADTVALAWQLSDAAGRPLGTVAQKNAVPAGMLEAGWGDVALLAAMGAAEGLVPLLENAPKIAAAEPAPAPAAPRKPRAPLPAAADRPPPELKLRPALGAP